MFLQSIADAKLLPHRDDTYIFQMIPLDTRQTILREMVLHLDSNVPGMVETLTTDAHVKFTMEFIGASLGLPLHTNCDVAEAALNIYESWLLDSRKPGPIQKNEEFYCREIFSHLSLLFRERGPYPHSKHTPGSQGILNTMLKIRLRALGMMAEVASKRFTTMKPSMWDSLLRTLLGIANEILENSGNALGRALQKEMISTLFYVWIHAQLTDPKDENTENLTDPALWEIFQRFVVGWLHREWFVIQWKRICRSLTDRILYTMYQGREGLDKVEISWIDDRPPLKLSLKDRKAIYLWNQMYHLIQDVRLLSNAGEALITPRDGQPRTVREPGDSECFRICAEGIVDLVDSFLVVGMSNRARTSQYPSDPCSAFFRDTALSRRPVSAVDVRKPWVSPDGTDILKTFGGGLFGLANTQMNLRDNIYSEGRASALGCLCRVFSQQNGQKLEPADLARFYQTIIQALVQDQTRSGVVYSILLNSTHLFKCGLKGSTVLIPSYVFHLRRIFTAKRPPFEDHIRRAALIILNSFIPLHTHFFDPSTLYCINHEVVSRSREPSMTHEKDKIQLKPETSQRTSACSEPPAPISKAPPPPLSRNKMLRPSSADIDSSDEYQAKCKRLPAHMGQMAAVKQAVEEVPELLISAMQTEKSNYNKELLLWMAVLQLHEQVKEYSSATHRLAGKMIDYIWEGINDRKKTWSKHLRVVGLRALCEIAPLHDHIRRSEESNRVQGLFSKLCDFLQRNSELSKDKKFSSMDSALTVYPGVAELKSKFSLQFGKRGVNEEESVLYSASKCLLSWVECANWVFKDTTVAQKVDKAIIAGILSGDLKTKQTCLSIQRLMLREVGRQPASFHPLATALHPLHPLHATLGPLPDYNNLSLFGPLSMLQNNTSLSSTLSQSEVLSYLNSPPNPPIHHFCLDSKTLITVIEVEKPKELTEGKEGDSAEIAKNKSLGDSAAESERGKRSSSAKIGENRRKSSSPSGGSSELVILVRDAGGKYIWTGRTIYDRYSSSDHTQEAGEDRGKEEKELLGKRETNIDLTKRSLDVSGKVAEKERGKGCGGLGFSNLDSASAYRDWATRVGGELKKESGGQEGSEVWKRDNGATGCVRPAGLTGEGGKALATRIFLCTMGLLNPLRTPLKWKNILASISTNAHTFKSVGPHKKRISKTDSKAALVSSTIRSNFERILPLRRSAKVEAELSKLDRISDRHTLTVAVLLRKKTQDKELNMCANETGPSAYNSFLRRLGAPVRVDSHKGFNGGLKPEDAQNCPYYSDAYLEIMFLVPTLMIASHKRRADLVSNASVHIIWSEDPSPFNPDFGALDSSTQATACPKVYIVIWTQPYDLYRVRIYTKGFPSPPKKKQKKPSNTSSTISSTTSSFSLFGTRRIEHKVIENLASGPEIFMAKVGHLRPHLLFGPLLNDSIINRSSLGFLVRSTCIRAAEYASRFTKRKSSPFENRAKFIADLIKNHTNISQLSTVDFLDFLFDATPMMSQH